MDVFSIARVIEYFPRVFRKLPITLEIVLVSLVIGLLLSLLLAIFRIYKTPVGNQIALVYISFMRGTPINVQLFVVYFGFPALIAPVCSLFGVDINQVSALTFVIITYGLNNAAWLAEVIRAAVLGVDKGQFEAAYAIGMSHGKAFRRIILPQAVRIMIPNVGNIVVDLLKSTSLAFSLGILDMVGVVKVIAASSMHSLEGYVCAAIIYCVFSIIIEQGFHALSRRLAVQA